MTEELEALTARLGDTVADLVPLPGGRSSRTYAAMQNGERIVVKVAPAGLPPVRNRDVLRQARLMRGLTDAPGVKVPRVLFEDSGDPPEVPPLFGMTFVEGDCFEPHIDPAETLPAAEEVTARALGAARMLAALHAADALADEPEIGLDAEVERWVKAFSTVDEELKPGADECAAALKSDMPKPMVSAIVHGDYRLGNMLCAGSEVQAIIDWEIWSRTDPRIDVAWFLLVSDPERHPSVIRDAPGMPRSPTLLAEYETVAGETLGDMGWFAAHTLFKLAAATALIVKNTRKLGTTQDIAPRALTNIPIMLERARAALES